MSLKSNILPVAVSGERNVGSIFIRQLDLRQLSPAEVHFISPRIADCCLRCPMRTRKVLQSTVESSSHVDDGAVRAEEISRATLIWRTVKLPIYSVVAVPLAVGSSAAYFQTGVFFAKRCLLIFFASALVLAWLNLSNDVYDFDTGADRNKPESVVNVTGSRDMTLVASIVSLVLGCLGIIHVAVEAGDTTRILLLIASAIFCGYIYQCPPFRLSYRGLGEPLCFAAFGPFATTALYLSQGYQGSSRLSSLPIDGTILSVSVLVGLSTTLILFCSHFHQIESDYAVGKMSPLVKMGKRVGSLVVKCGVVSLYLLSFIFCLYKTLPWTCALLCTLTVPVGKIVVDYVERNHQEKVKIFMAKYYCVCLYSLFGAALCAGLLLAR